MSDITPLSYIDDGHSFSRRLPSATSLANVSRWLNNTASPTTSAYTGSYIDDGADLFLPTTCGFGQVDPRFYRHKKRHEGAASGAWNDDIARAVGGDISHSLAKLRGVANLDVKRPKTSSKEDKKRRQKRKGVVSVPAPLKWGTFVIKGDNGRVVVIDEKGEFDSGPVRAGQEVGDGGRKGEGKRWVRAVSSVDTPVSTLQCARQKDRTRSGKDEKSTSASHSKSKSKSKSKSRANSHTTSRGKETRRPKPLTPIPESVSSYSDDDPVNISPIASPTDFFMTGGLSGWPSRTPSLDPPSAIVPHAITWDTTSPPRSTSVGTRMKTSSPVRSPPGGWPSPPASAAKSSSSSFTNLKDHGSRERRSKSSRHSSGHRKEGEEFDKISAKSFSAYSTPDIVEVIYDETPPGEVSASQIGSGAEEAASARDWNNEDVFQAKAWSGSHNDGTGKSFRVSDLGWGGSAKGSGWGGSRAGSKTGSFHGWDDNEKHSHDGSHEAWDGFERPKTTSEVSIAGTGSERSWPASQHSQHTRGSHRSRRSHASYQSNKRNRHSQTGWDNKAARTVHWGGSDAQSKHSWSQSKHGSEKSWAGSSPTKYQNGFDEDNKTYLNETWGGIPVRVASRRTSVAGWD
ncbi:hypothetical protein BU25DRAFT_411741 [Macroventuria anomochaeta]|uniref:Uncharacterized protein n=1 Tax=Macroventuria anomochaeta TaxID=301207 RepID=A0ACB6RY39_9PLEO|nr:uncharacterized protein BU25DRAFT_411741 [Macroventuria anomochaeta]KAF2626335.1 hypothetical protein BU25DRAFT_411741 [Macroventuria anomochaeta]